MFSRRRFSLPFTEKSSILPASTGFRAIYQWREHVEAGGLLSYGPVLASMWRQAGVIVTRILKGANPMELPIEQPTKLELAVNAKTAPRKSTPLNEACRRSAESCPSPRWRRRSRPKATAASAP